MASMADLGHALAQPGVVTEKFVERHPETTGVLALVEKGHLIERLPATRPRSQDGDGLQGQVALRATGESVAVTGVFLRTAIGRAEDGQKQCRSEPPAMRDVFAVNMSEFVPDVKIDGVGLFFQGINDVREENDVVTAEEACRKGVEQAIAAHQVRFGLGSDAQAFAAVSDAISQVGKLVLVDADRIAFQEGDQRRVCGQRDHIEGEDIEPDESHRADGQAQPDQAGRDGEEGVQFVFGRVGRDSGGDIHRSLQ